MGDDSRARYLGHLSTLLLGCRWIAWILASCAAVISLAMSGGALSALLVDITPSARQPFDAVVLPFFAAVIAQLVITARLRPARRLALAQLAAGMAFWAASTVISTIQNGTPQPLQFPSLADGVVLTGAVCFAGFVILDRRGRETTPAMVWLNTVVIAGSAIATLSAASLLGPVQTVLAHIPASVFIDLVLAGVVINQCRRGRRSWRISGIRLVISLGLMAVADLVQRGLIIDGRTSYPLMLDLMWALAILLITGAATSHEPRPPLSPQPRMIEGVATLAGLMTATLVLAFAPPGPVRTLAVAPALLAVGAAAARALLALRTVQTAAESVRQSQTDALTGLPNRRAVEAHLAEETGSGGQAVAIINLRGFKDLNDTLGHVAGDAFLQIMADRLRLAAPANVLVARLAADEFCVAFPAESEALTLAQAEALLETLRDSVTIEGLTLTPDWSVGIATSDHPTKELLRQADIAVYHAKRNGGMTQFDPTLDTYTRARLELGEELRRALVSDQLELWYQPQLGLQNDEIDGVEALVRWRHPSQGLVPPGVFLEAGRRLGLMPAMTEIIIRLACRQAAIWRKQGLCLRMSVNMGADELLSAPLINLLLEQIAAEGLPRHSITIEVTEESFLVNRELAKTMIQRLVSAGVDVSVDDYGTGFSSLTYLRHLPLRELKIDQSFVMKASDDRRSRTIVAATAALAHALDMRVVAEGVETEEVLEALRDLPVDSVQGYYIAKPMPAEEATQWLRWRMNSSDRLPIPPIGVPSRIIDSEPGLVPAQRKPAEATSHAKSIDPYPV